jgi:hypothetical protein
MKKLLSTMGLGLILISASAVAFAAEKSSITLQDRADILELIANYSFTWDAADQNGFSALFTDDAEGNWYINGQKTPAIAVKGMKEIRELVPSRAAVFAKKGLITKHLMPNSTIENISNTEAKVTTHAMIYWQLKGVDLLPKAVQAGYYYSVVKKVNGKWKFKRRDVYLNGAVNLTEVYPSLK